jgi:hypothetical protein
VKVVAVPPASLSKLKTMGAALTDKTLTQATTAIRRMDTFMFPPILDSTRNFRLAFRSKKLYDHNGFAAAGFCRFSFLPRDLFFDVLKQAILL